MLALPVAAEDAAGESDSLFEHRARADSSRRVCRQPRHQHRRVREKQRDPALRRQPDQDDDDTAPAGKLPGSARLHQPDRAKLHLRFNLGAKHDSLQPPSSAGARPKACATCSTPCCCPAATRPPTSWPTTWVAGSIDNFVAMMNDEAKAVAARHNVCRSLRAEPQQHHDGA